MRLYLSAETNIPDVYIDYIEVRLQNGQEVSLTWDESDISRNETGFDARYRGVYFDDEYANDRLEELSDMQITDVGLYYESEGAFQFRITEMEFEDFETSLSFPNPEMPDSLQEVLGVSPPLEGRLNNAIAKSNAAQAPPTKDPERDY